MLKQQLQFEASWDRALAEKDQKLIEKIFNATYPSDHREVICSFIRVAINHKEELLVTALVHNYMDCPLVFENVRVLYRIKGQVLADNLFTLSALVIPPYVSMPWTFIFPQDRYILKSSMKNGRLEIYRPF